MPSEKKLKFDFSKNLTQFLFFGSLNLENISRKEQGIWPENLLPTCLWQGGNSSPCGER